MPASRPHKIIINGRPKTVTKDILSYEDLLRLVYGENVDTDMVVSVTYHGGPGDKSEGILSRGRVVGVRAGMVFNAMQTNNA